MLNLKKIFKKAIHFFRTCNNCGEFEHDCECIFGGDFD
jgi:hypothetical protein